MNTPAKNVVLLPEAGERLTVVGGHVRVLIDGEHSGGRCCMFECPIPPGDGPPLHRHTHEDEYFFVLEGRFKFSIDGREFIGERSAFACAPRGSAHAFRNVGTDVGVLHVTCTPAGLDAAFREARVPDAGRAGSGKTPPSPQEVAAIFERYGITFVGPPLDECEPSR